MRHIFRRKGRNPRFSRGLLEKLRPAGVPNLADVRVVVLETLATFPSFERGRIDDEIMGVPRDAPAIG